ncbi:MAG TPA: CapA family protein [Anaerolineales bacterium]|nr:CapA family protein [Anaerolineales bacterium]
MTARSIFSFLLILVTLLPGCSSLPQPPQPSHNTIPTIVAPLLSIATLTPGPNQPVLGQDFAGRVVDMDGNPIPGAQIESLKDTAISNQDGWFQFSGQGLPQWLKVTASGFISRTRAAAPGIPVLFRLTPDDGKTVVIHFAGDIMFGRRFFDPNEDDYTADGLLPLEPTVEDHLRLLAPIKPLLENADFTVANLDTTLSTPAFFPKSDPRPDIFHPTAGFVYASDPNSVAALKQAGVDIVDLGNNHSYDLLEAGLSNSLASLYQADMLHFGAGTNEANAWAPVVISAKGQKIAFIGCTTLRIPLRTPIKNDVPYVASDVRKKGGAAYCAESRLRSEVIKAKQQANIVIVMIHGGQEYDPTPTNKISYLTEIARQAGATLIINHFPHVVGGFAWRDQSLIAWTIGNFLSDQVVWPSSESYMLAVYLREGKVIRAYVEPLIVDGFLPHGLTGELADYVVRGAAGREPGPFVMESGAMELDVDGRALQKTYSQTIDGGSKPGTIIAIPQAQWISGFHGPGKLLLGRDLLWVGGFENEEVDSASHGAPLWDLESGSIRIGRDFAYEGQTGIHLTRDINNLNDAVTTNLHRVLVDPYASLSITGMVRLNQGGDAQVQFSWYSAISGPSFLKYSQPIEVQSYDSWQPFRLEVQVPSKAVALGLYLRLKPPSVGTVTGPVTADFDNIRIIEWANPGAAFSPLYNYARLTGSGDLTFAQEFLPGAEDWPASPLIDPNK